MEGGFWNEKGVGAERRAGAGTEQSFWLWKKIIKNYYCYNYSMNMTGLGGE